MNYLQVDEDSWINFDNVTEITLSTHKKTGRTKVRFEYYGGYANYVRFPSRAEALKNLQIWFEMLDQKTINPRIMELLKEDKNEIQK